MSNVEKGLPFPDAILTHKAQLKATHRVLDGRLL
jgi:hypothetical protein